MPVNSILRVQGFVQATPTAFVLDSGAAISVIRYDKIPSKQCYVVAMGQ